MVSIENFGMLSNGQQVKKYIIKLGGILWIINLYIIKLQA